ncbi:MAG: hypothetical protein LBF68_01540 [Christensenellaceae bacterium]|nr:hypothetical protein [Christensenellaceae bacterium]
MIGTRQKYWASLYQRLRVDKIGRPLFKNSAETCKYDISKLKPGMYRGTIKKQTKS